MMGDVTNLQLRRTDLLLAGWKQPQSFKPLTKRMRGEGKKLNKKKERRRKETKQK